MSKARVSTSTGDAPKNGDPREQSNGPLAGMRILEVSHFLAGPYCTMMLADLGADVIKVETGAGDIARSTGGHEVGGHNVYFSAFNRNKRSVLLDLTDPTGRETFGRLAATSRALVTNLRPPAVKKLGLTYEALKSWNPDLVCLAVTGYGLEGPQSHQPVMDYVVQARAGLMHLNGEPDDPPTRVGYSVVDNTTALMAALALVAKLAEGKGGQVDVSLYDTMLSQMNYLAASLLNAGEAPRRYPDGSHPYFVPAQRFRTRDGWISIFVPHDEAWRALALAAERPEWAEDPRFSTIPARAEHRETLVAEVGALFLQQDSAWWEKRLVDAGVVASNVRTLEEALEDPLTNLRNMVVSMETSAGPLRGVGLPIKVEGHRPGYRPPPKLGEHTGEIIDALPPSKNMSQER